MRKNLTDLLRAYVMTSNLPVILIFLVYHSAGFLDLLSKNLKIMALVIIPSKTERVSWL